MDKRKKRIVGIGAVFIVFVSVMLLFSQTIQTYGLPTVVLGYAKEDVLIFSLLGEGVVELTDEYKVFAPVDGKIDGLPKKGDLVAASEVLFTVTPEIDTEDSSLEEEAKILQIEQYIFDVKQIDDDISNIRKSIAYLQKYSSLQAEAKNQQTEEFDAYSYDVQIETYDAKIAIAKKELDTLSALYNEGIIAKSELDEAVNNYTMLEMEKEQIVAAKDNAREKYLKNIEQNQESIKTQDTMDALSLEQSIANEEDRIKSLLNNKKKIQNQIQILSKTLKIPEEKTVVCEYDSMVTAVEAENGDTVSKNSYIVKVSPLTGNFESDITVDSGFERISIGDMVTIAIEGGETINILSKVIGKYYENAEGHIRVSFQSGELYGGEKVQMVHYTASEPNTYVLPNNAIRRDVYTDYILIAVETNGFLFKDYVAEKVDVVVLESDNQNTAFLPNYSFGDNSVIIYSDGVVMSGSKVRIVGESDLFVHN